MAVSFKASVRHDHWRPARRYAIMETDHDPRGLQCRLDAMTGHECRHAGSSGRRGRCTAPCTGSRWAGSDCGGPGSSGGAPCAMMVGRRSGRERGVIPRHVDDGADLVTMAMNGWASGRARLVAQPPGPPRRHRGAGRRITPRAGPRGRRRRAGPPVVRDGARSSRNWTPTPRVAVVGNRHRGAGAAIRTVTAVTEAPARPVMRRYIRASALAGEILSRWPYTVVGRRLPATGSSPRAA